MQVAAAEVLVKDTLKEEAVPVVEVMVVLHQHLQLLVFKVDLAHKQILVEVAAALQLELVHNTQALRVVEVVQRELLF